MAVIHVVDRIHEEAEKAVVTVNPSKENRFVAVAEVVVAVAGQEEDSAVLVEDSMMVTK